MSLAPTLAEVERAKSQLKASLLLSLDGTTAIAEDVSLFFTFRESLR
jgi:processing peptidase subunit beta